MAAVNGEEKDVLHPETHVMSHVLQNLCSRVFVQNCSEAQWAAGPRARSARPMYRHPFPKTSGVMAMGTLDVTDTKQKSTVFRSKDATSGSWPYY